MAIVLIAIIGLSSVAMSGAALADDRCDDYPINQLDLQSSGDTPLSGVAVTANTNLEDTDTFGANPGEPYFQVDIDGREIVQSGVVERTAGFERTFQIPNTAVKSLDAGQHSVTVILWDKDGDDIDDTDLGNDDVICEKSATFTVEQDRAPSGITSVVVSESEDPDGDGFVSAVTLEVQATTLLPNSDVTGNNPGEPYFVVRISDEVVHRTEQVDRVEDASFRVALTSEDLQSFGQDQYELAVELWDRDGDEFDPGLTGNDDEIDAWTGAIKIDQPVRIRASRDSTVVGSPVAVQLTGAPDSDVSWRVTEQPVGSDMEVHTEYKHTVSVRATVPGTYELTAEPVGSSVTRSVTITVQETGEMALLRRFAPRLHYAAEESFFPTRFEAFIYNARLQQFGAENVPNPTVFDLQGREGWELDLKGSSNEYLRYQSEYPATVYGSVHEDVSFRGEQYTAVTYWLFYVYDPKQSGTIGALFAHQSDLETVTILVQDGTPEWVGASQHYGGELRRWTEVPRNGTHPHVYPALGAHSNYFRNTERYSGLGIPIQEQFIDKTSLNTSLAFGWTLEEYLDITNYIDQTGADVTYTHNGSGDRPYQLVPLTGEEVWASYEGSFNPDDQSGAPPFQRARWRNPGQWMENTLPPDEAQFDVSLSSGDVTPSTDGIRSSLQVVNRGPKPHPVWVVVEAKPVDANWDDSVAVTLYEEPVFVGVGDTREMTVDTDPPKQAGQWDVRVRLTAYPPSLVDAVQLLGQVTADRSITVTTPSTSSPTGPDSSVTASVTTGGGRSGTAGTATPAAPAMSGFGFQMVLGAMLVFIVSRYRT